MGLAKINLDEKNKRFVFNDHFHREDYFRSTGNLNVELVKIEGAPDIMEMSLTLRTKAITYSFPLFRHRLKLLKEGDIFYWDTSGIKALQGLLIEDLQWFEVKKEFEPHYSLDFGGEYKVTLYCSTVPKTPEPGIQYL